MMSLPGCGLFIPGPHEIYEAKSNDEDFVNVIFNNIKCELRNSGLKILNGPGAAGNPRVQWLARWGAKVDLKFTTDEAGSFNPGVLFNPPPPFSLGLNLASSGRATRIEDAAVTYGFAELTKQGKPVDCANEDGILIQSNLDIDGFLFKYVNLLSIPGTLPSDDPKMYDTLTYQVTFVASFDANITPTWTFRHVTVDPSGKLLDAQRTKTSNLIITFSHVDQSGPAAQGPAAVSLDQQGQLAHLAAVIGQAVAASTQAVSH